MRCRGGESTSIREAEATRGGVREMRNASGDAATACSAVCAMRNASDAASVCHSFLIPYGFIPSSALHGVRAREQDWDRRTHAHTTRSRDGHVLGTLRWTYLIVLLSYLDSGFGPG